METTSNVDPWWRRLPPAVLTDVPVAVALLICWLLVPLGWAHVLTGLVLAALIVGHLRTRGRGLNVLHGLRPPGAARARMASVSYLVLLAAGVAMMLTGVLRWGGVAPERVWHGGISYLLLAVVLIHVGAVRAALRARLRRLRHPSEGDRGGASG